MTVSYRQIILHIFLGKESFWYCFGHLPLEVWLDFFYVLYGELYFNSFIDFVFLLFDSWYHCVKIVQIRRFFWSVFSRIWTEYEPEKTPYFDTFYTVYVILENSNIKKNHSTFLYDYVHYGSGILYSKFLLKNHFYDVPEWCLA